MATKTYSFTCTRRGEQIERTVVADSVTLTPDGKNGQNAVFKTNGEIVASASAVEDLEILTDGS